MSGARRRGRRPMDGGPSTRDRILRAARELFSEVGYDRASLTDIAERAGLTRPAIKYYFVGKEDLYAALFESVRDGVVAAGIKNAAEQHSLSARLAAFLQTASQVDSQDRTYARFIAASLLDTVRYPELAHSQLTEVRTFVEQALEAAIEAGEIRPDTDVSSVTEMLIAVTWGMGLYAGYVGTHDQLEAVVAQFTRLLEGELW